MSSYIQQNSKSLEKLLPTIEDFENNKKVIKKVIPKSKKSKNLSNNIDNEDFSNDADFMKLPSISNNLIGVDASNSLLL